MNLDALKRNPAFRLKNFNYSWVRVTDINLAQIRPGRYELLVGHHYFQPEAQCMELKLSRAVLRVAGNDISLSEPFQTVLTTKPCITFFSPDSEHVFEGHFSGGRIARLSTDQVLFSTGDHGWAGLRGYPAVSQEDDSTLGKVLLVNPSTKDVSIFAKGMRNPQGLAIDSHGRIWQTEQGPMGGDELNLVVKGQNYGWPESTYGTDYPGQGDGPRPWPLNAEQGRHSTGVKPQFAWNPSIGVSNLIEVTGNEFPLWKGDLLVLSLVGQSIHRLRLEGTRVVYDEPINFRSSRLRDIVELPNGYLAVLTDVGTLIFLRNSENHGHEPYLDAGHQQKRTIDMSEQERVAAVAGFHTAASQPKPNNSNHLSNAAAQGEQVFKKNCASCHSLDTDEGSVGPSLKNVVGRRVGSTGFPYSSALLARRETWSGRHIADFVAHPNSIYAGTSMAPVSLAPELQMELAEYLDEVSR
jgi:cytochrome c2